MSEVLAGYERTIAKYPYLMRLTWRPDPKALCDEVRESQEAAGEELSSYEELNERLGKAFSKAFTEARRTDE